MSALVQTELVSFNSLALRIQDDAYTLAYYLLGDDTLASEATQAAFARAYTYFTRHGSLRQDAFRLEALRDVLKSCRTGGETHAQVAAQNDLSGRLLALRVEERAVAVLVDVLNLSYHEAAAVAGCSVKELAKRLGHARFTLGRTLEIHA